MSDASFKKWFDAESDDIAASMRVLMRALLKHAYEAGAMSRVAEDLELRRVNRETAGEFVTLFQRVFTPGWDVVFHHDEQDGYWVSLEPTDLEREQYVLERPSQIGAKYASLAAAMLEAMKAQEATRANVDHEPPETFGDPHEPGRPDQEELK